MAIKTEKQQSIWEGFKEVFPLLMICAAVFAAGMMIADYKNKHKITTGYWFGLCLETSAKHDQQTFAECSRIAYIMNERYRK